MLITEQDLLEILNIKIGDKVRLNKIPGMVVTICIDNDRDKNLGYRLRGNGEFKPIRNLIGVYIEKIVNKE